MKILFAGGGTSGHINPALAVAETLSEKYPDADIRFFGTEDRIESDLVPRAGYKLYSVPMSGLSRQFTPDGIMHNLNAAKLTAHACAECRRIFKEFRPDVVVGTGGYIAFPAVYTAQVMRIPTILVEPNAQPGVVTKMLCKKADRVFVNFKQAKNILPAKCHVFYSGSPVRRDILFSTDRRTAKQMLGFADKPLVVSFWGSLGARNMNEKMIEFIKLEQKERVFTHIHAAGSKNYEVMRKRIASCGFSAADESFSLREYIYDMPQVLAAADVVLCRAGASTLAEICAIGRAAVIVPSHNVTENHQEKNARELEAAGAAEVVTEPEATGALLYDKVKRLLEDAPRRAQMEQNAHAMARPDAAECICEAIAELKK